MRTKTVGVGVIVLLLLGTGCERQKLPLPPEQQQALPQWSVWGGNLRHTANAADPVEFYVGPQLGREVWSQKLSGDVGGAPSIHSDGTIYVGSGPANLGADSGFVYALHPNGTVKWRFRTERPVVMSGALGQDGTYYVGDWGGRVYAIDPDGNLRWTTEAGAYVWGHPAITRDGILVFPSYDRLSAFRCETGELVWELAADIRGQRGVSISHDGTIYVGTHSSLLATKEDGTVLWERPFSLGPLEVLIGSEGTLYVQVPQDSFFYAIDPAGSLKWKFNLGFPAMGMGSSPALSLGDSIYVVKPGAPQQLLVLNREGTEVRRLNLVELSGGEGGVAVNFSAPVVDAEGTVYLSFLPGGGLPNWYAIEASGLLRWGVLVAPHDPFGMYPPAIGPDGNLYVSSQLHVHRID